MSITKVLATKQLVARESKRSSSRGTIEFGVAEFRVRTAMHQWWTWTLWSTAASGHGDLERAHDGANGVRRWAMRGTCDIFSDLLASFLNFTSTCGFRNGPLLFVPIRYYLEKPCYSVFRRGFEKKGCGLLVARNSSRLESQIVFERGKKRVSLKSLLRNSDGWSQCVATKIVASYCDPTTYARGLVCHVEETGKNP